MTLQIVIFGFVAALAEVLGGILVVSRQVWPRRVQETFLALGAGFILALVFLKLIPASFSTLGETAALYILVGFAVLHFFEHAIVGHLHFGEEIHEGVMVSRTASLSAFAGLCIHAFFDGLSISVGVQFDAFLGLLIFAAVLLHKFPEGLTIGSIMSSGRYPKKAILLSTIGIGLATILGTCTVFFFSNVDAEITGSAFAFAAGTVLYVGASDLIPEINKSRDRIPPLMVFLGMVLFYVSERLLEGLLR
ncbi:MAG: ZIP family metal transporter [Ignavibacteriales bacterium]|nr:ZIP family metal transporter [Ignavibacteriales bacterium]